MLRVRDIMTSDVYAVEKDASAEEAAWGLTRRHIGGAPVRVKAVAAGLDFSVPGGDPMNAGDV